MKKIRGKNRYYRNLWEQVKTIHTALDFGHDGWFDMWHTHLDFAGVGNTSPKARREHVKAHLAVYANLLGELAAYDKPYQSWIELNGDDASMDAVYIHTPNPHANNFPLKMEDLNWECDIPKEFEDLIDLKEFYVGQYKTGDDSNYIIQSRDKGIKL